MRISTFLLTRLVVLLVLSKQIWSDKLNAKNFYYIHSKSPWQKNAANSNSTESIVERMD